MWGANAHGAGAGGRSIVGHAEDKTPVHQPLGVHHHGVGGLDDDPGRPFTQLLRDAAEVGICCEMGLGLHGGHDYTTRGSRKAGPGAIETFIACRLGFGVSNR